MILFGFVSVADKGLLQDRVEYILSGCFKCSHNNCVQRNSLVENVPVINIGEPGSGRYRKYCLSIVVYLFPGLSLALKQHAHANELGKLRMINSPTILNTFAYLHQVNEAGNT